jgi:hypothetical protein
METVPSWWFYLSLLAIVALATWVGVLRSVRETAVSDIRYWRAYSQQWQRKVEQLSDLVRQLEQNQR